MDSMPILLQKDNTFTKLFVGGLPYHTTDDTLRAFFSQYGDIEEAVVIKDRSTGKSLGYGFVTMTDRDGAERACNVPNPMVDGRKANVNLAYLGAKRKSPKNQPGSPLGLGIIGPNDLTNVQFPAQHSPPHLPLQANGFFLPPIPPPGFGYDSVAPPFSPPPMIHPFFYSYYFNPSGGFNQPPPPFPVSHRQVPPLVQFNSSN